MPSTSMLSAILSVPGVWWILQEVKLLLSLLVCKFWDSEAPPSGEKPTVRTQNMATTSDQPKSLFALIIGINEYRNLKDGNLEGATVDADSAKAYLENSLAVPSSNIHLLKNEQATRVAIKQALYDLIADPRINKGDTILIYYAGHGGTTDAPLEWHLGGEKIQMIIPHDYGTEPNGSKIHGIPDRTFGALLCELAKEKDNNITVIFDCCYSGSGTRVFPSNDTIGPSRSITEKDGKLRGIKYDLTVPKDLDEIDWVDWVKQRRRYFTVPRGFAYHGLASHVHLAACGDREFAWEDSDGGVFTLTLIKTLNSLEMEGVSQISHKDLIRRIGPLPSQQPRCEGKHSDRLFLRRMTFNPEVVMYNLNKRENEYVLRAGKPEGITKDSTFTIYNKSPWYELGTLIASNPGSSSTKMNLPPGDYPFDIEKEAVAIPIGSGEEGALRLHIPPDADTLSKDILQKASDELIVGITHQRKVVFYDSPLADLEAKVEGDRLVFDTLFEPATRYGIRRLQVDVSAKVEDAKPVLLAAAHYYWHLKRVLAAQRGSFDFVEFVELKEEAQQYRGDDVDVLVPYGENLIKNGIVELELKPKEVVGDEESEEEEQEGNQYGMKVTNKAKHPVYIWVFFFDHGDFTITPLYRSPTAGSGEVPIAPGDSLTIGYGDGGIEPMCFELDDKYDMDVGFVVVVISNKPIDLSDMAQRRPKRALVKSPDGNTRKRAGYWHTLVIPIVQRKAEA